MKRLLAVTLVFKRHPVPALRRRQLRGRHAEAIPVTVKHDIRRIALGPLVRLNPLAPPRALVHGLEEADGAALDVGAVVLAHDRLDRLAGLVGVVKGMTET